MRDQNKKNNPSESCEMPKPITDAGLRVLLESSTYTGVDDEHEDSPHWMDRNHDYGGGYEV